MKQILSEVIAANALELETLLAVKARSYQEKRNLSCQIGELIERHTNRKFFHNSEVGMAFLVWKAGKIIFDELASIAEMHWRYDSLNDRKRLPETPFNFPNAYGVYQTLETVEIKLPASTRTQLFIRLTKVPGGLWRYSTEYKMPLSGGSSGVSIHSTAFQMREDALITGGKELRTRIDGQWNLESDQRKIINYALDEFINCRAPQLTLF